MKLKKSIKSLIVKIDKFSPSPFFYPFVMSKSEKELFDHKVRNAKGYLEFGMGGSTIRALKISSAKVFSQDSSLEWISTMRKYYLIRHMEKKRSSLYHVNIGPVKKWGYPDGDDFKSLYPDYSASIFNLLEDVPIDTVLIDGRFRVACTLKTIIEFAGNKNLHILIHDFYKRADYHVVLKYLDLVDRADTLGAFVIKDNLDLSQVKADYEEYKYISN